MKDLCIRPGNRVRWKCRGWYYGMTGMLVKIEYGIAYVRWHGRYNILQHTTLLHQLEPISFDEPKVTVDEAFDRYLASISQNL